LVTFDYGVVMLQIPERGFYIYNEVKYEESEKVRVGKAWQRPNGMEPAREPNLENLDELQIIFCTGTEEVHHQWWPRYFGKNWKPLLWICEELSVRLQTEWDRYETSPIPYEIPPYKPPRKRGRNKL
jgi:hypothetical protein